MLGYTLKLGTQIGFELLRIRTAPRSRMPSFPPNRGAQSSFDVPFLGRTTPSRQDAACPGALTQVRLPLCH
jgi:hypothetical protein